MNETLTNLIDTAIKIKENFSNEEIRLEEPQKQVSTGHITNPCIICDLKEWCCEDDCAKKGYPIDLPTTRFKNLDEMITCFRTHDILGL